MDRILIPWKIGEGNIEITGDFSTGNLLISSSTNDNVERTQTLTFLAANGGTAKLLVKQKGNYLYLEDKNRFIITDNSNNKLIVKEK